MPVDELGRDRSMAARLIGFVAVCALVAGVVAAWRAASGGLVVGLLAVAAVAGLLASRRKTKARSARQEHFETWARTRGLVLDPAPLPGLDRLIDPDRPVLLQETALSVICAASTGFGSSRITVMEWEHSTGNESGRLLRMAGLILTIPATGSHLVLRPAGRVRLPHIPGTSPTWRSGYPELDDRFVTTVEGGREPAWIDPPLAAALVSAGHDDASIEIRNDLVLVARVRNVKEDWETLLGDGQRLVAAFQQALG